MKKAIKTNYPNPKTFKHKQWYRATIQGKECIGQVSIDSDGCVYLCQSENCGNEADDKLGFPYSWIIVRRNKYIDVFGSQVSSLKLLSRKPAGFVKLIKPIEIGNYTMVKIAEDKIKFGCTYVSKEKYLEVGYYMGWIE